jgi:streptogramin lyase
VSEIKSLVAGWRRTSIVRLRRWSGLSWVLLASVLGLWVVLSSLGWLAPTSAGSEPFRAAASESILSADYLYRLEPTSGTFLTIPLSLASRPADVHVVSESLCQNIWFSEPGLRRIGRVVYTSTSDYSLDEFDVGAAPVSLAASDSAVWFTIPEQSQVGHLDPANGIVTLFDLPTAQADPADIAVDANGQAWVTERAGNQLAFATISPTVVITEFVLPKSGLMPEGILLDDGGNVWFAASAAGTLWRFTPATGQYVTLTVAGPDSQPYRLAQNDASVLWTTLRNSNQLAQVLLGTLPLTTAYTVLTSNSHPGAVDIDSQGRVFFAEQSVAQIGQLVVTPTASFTEYPLPQPNLKLTGLAVGGDDSVWAVAYRDVYQARLPLVMRDYDSLMYKVRLPIVMQDYDTTPPPFAIQMYGDIRPTADFTRVVESGAKWVRLQVYWASIEPNNTTPDHYNWSALDASVQTAEVADINLILTIEGNPGWAAASACGPVYNLADLQEFVGALVVRYPKVQYWELYNEPDGKSCFGGHGADYAAMLKAVYPSVKAANPSALVVMGGLALDWFYQGDDGVFDRYFLRDAVANCSGPCFDVANFHFYPKFRKMWEGYGRDIIGKANYVRQVIRSYDYDRPIICTETSWPTVGVWGGESPQARYAPKSYARGLAAGLGVVNWYAWRDSDISNTGLLKWDGTPRWAYYTYQAAASLLQSARFVRAIPSSETGSAQIEGYQFSVPGSGGRKRLDIYWYDCPTMYASLQPTDCSEAATLTINANRIARIDMNGSRTILNGGGGHVSIPGGVNTYPIYIDYDP